MRALAALLLAAALTACANQGDDGSCPAEPAASATANPNADPDLAATIPDEVAGESLHMGTFCATELDELGGIETSPEMLEALGVELKDVTLAATSPQIGAPGGTFSVGAYRFEGADEETIRETFLRLLAESATEMGIDPDIEEATIGGKDVHRAIGVVFYFVDDTMYSVQSGDDAKVEEILEALP